MFFKSKTNIKGFSLIETIVYVTIFSILLASVSYSTMILLSSYQKTKVVRRIENSAIASMDRMEKDIRNSTSVDTANSTFNTSSGSLSLISGSTTTKYYLLNNQIYISENGSVLGPITFSNVRVSSLIFNFISTSTSEAIKIEMTITGDSSTPIKNFYNTAVLRGSYK